MSLSRRCYYRLNYIFRSFTHTACVGVGRSHCRHHVGPATGERSITHTSPWRPNGLRCERRMLVHRRVTIGTRVLSRWASRAGATDTGGYNYSQESFPHEVGESQGVLEDKLVTRKRAAACNCVPLPRSLMFGLGAASGTCRGLACRSASVSSAV